VSDEQTPDPMANLFANHDETRQTPAPLMPAQPQFSSRREARNAASASAKRSSAKRSAEARTSSSSRKADTTNKPRGAKLSRRDAAAVRKLAATPRIDAGSTASSGSSKPPKKQNPLKAIAVLVVITGFVGCLALPAVAAPTGANFLPTAATNSGHTQKMTVDADIETSKITRDSVSATSEAQLRTEQINAATLSSAPGVRAPGDDYPWRTAGYGLSPLNYYYRQCVDFVAWRLNRDAGVTSAPWKWTWSTLTPGGGDASQWKAAWVKHGWTTSATPVVGSVAWFVGNHVAYVHLIQGSNVVIEEYNGQSSRAYAMRTIPISSVGRFLYPPP
jgi:peptidoglycan DL-endopeptidase CwlO